MNNNRKKLPTVLEVDEANKLLSIPSKRYPTGIRNRAILSVMLNMGLRLNEVISLKPSDINLTKNKLKVVNGKGSKDRLLGIPDHTAMLLDKYKTIKPKNTEYFFTTLNGNKMSDRYIQNMLVRYCAKANIKKIYPHSLRHTYATEYYRRTKDIETLRRILGHSDISTTTIYITLANIEVENSMKTFKEFV